MSPACLRPPAWRTCPATDPTSSQRQHGSSRGDTRANDSTGQPERRIRCRHAARYNAVHAAMLASVPRTPTRPACNETQARLSTACCQSFRARHPGHAAGSQRLAMFDSATAGNHGAPPTDAVLSSFTRRRYACSRYARRRLALKPPESGTPLPVTAAAQTRS